MVEGLAILTGVELGKWVLDQVLDLGKPVLESYVQDFFRDCLDSGVAHAKASALKQPMAEAIGFFIQRLAKELQYNGIPSTSFDHYYNAAIKKFVRDKAIRSILGKAFDRENSQLDHAQLGKIWEEKYENLSWRLSAEALDWRRIAWDYQEAVKGIIKADNELRDILNSNLLEDIARNTAQLSPGFDTETYRASLQASYGYLKLYTLDSTDRTDTIKLWNIFIEQTVREALPPTRYDLPLDIKRQLQAEGRLEDTPSTEALEYYRRDYFQQPARKVLEAIADSPRTVILGDPGAGKSSLLQYLALEWVEDNTDTLPLLIELREFVLADSTSFLDFLHRGRGVNWQFDQQQLHQHLLESPALVMFDGLDEIFDHATQSAVIDDIIRFAQQYPQTRVLVTSRIVGYNHERLQHSGFRHFTLQSLDTDEIHEFIDRWYALSMGSDPECKRLKQRLKDAITNSKAIQNLADNPLLLTMMAILNRRQELPRDRADLYDQASRVLLYHWDVDHKRLNLPMDAIGRREKQEMLRVIAYEMQACEDGLKGNIISADRLTQILTNYLRNQGFSEPREKAHRLIQQLRERNFILCYRGADTYSFMHRTFLEYFCAVEIVHRFEKQRTLTFDQLRDEVFGSYWQDESWREVLQLICGMLNEHFSIEVIKSLREQKNTWGKSINLVVASQCLKEVQAGSSNHVKEISDELFYDIQRVILLDEVSDIFDDTSDRKPWDLWDEKTRIQLESVEAISHTWSNAEGTLEFLKFAVVTCYNDSVQIAAAELSIKLLSSKDKDIQNFLIDCVRSKEDWNLQLFSIAELSRRYGTCQETFDLLIETARSLELVYLVSEAALSELAVNWNDDSRTLDTFKFYISNHPEPDTRAFASQKLSKFWKGEDAFRFFLSRAYEDPFNRSNPVDKNPRIAAISVLLNGYPRHSQVLESFQRMADADSDEEARHWAQEQLQRLASNEAQ